jgi:hypothetical protein
MNIERNLIDANGERERAAEIRAGWSEFDRMQRTGLPPDIPWRLQQHLEAFLALARQRVLARRARRLQLLAAVSDN